MSRLAALFGRFRRGDAESREKVLLQRMAGLEDRIERLSARLEDAASHLAQRAHPLHFHQSAYLGDHTALAMLHARHMLFVDTRGTDIAPHLIMNGIWETAYTTLFQRLIRPNDLVLDIGANHGVYAVLAAAAGARVAAFEPNPRLCELMRRSASVNGFSDRLSVYEAAVGDVDGEVHLAFDNAWPGGGHVVEAGSQQAGVSCRVLPLDAFFSDPGITVDVIKMDVEGTEGRALMGMRGLLARSPRVRIMMEFAPVMLNGHGVGPAVVVGILRELGFRFWEIGSDSGLTQLEPETLARASDDSVRNILVARQDP
ncbi:FkbM family methyltransferase [Roseomonas xinghualingensis]|uniref:FkbM family methyltransferase n=1 Tax=Roseomonas xinghualingensis TaxID=2986475 RepID=UPI0021F24A03|nr:FkbM family methyltransferase [Roseomonas sp. SXEYE001]MCV4206552.1 FkbM family methyltransferase [Roseomonas sp. SXEYE001]